MAEITGLKVALQGEIYNAPALCIELGLPGKTTHQDLVACGWHAWSAQLLCRLEGVFVLALQDAQGLALYRDPSGLHKLYWGRGTDGQILYGTDLLALARIARGGRRVARHALHEYLRLLDISAPHTLFDGIHAVEAGQLLRFGPQHGDGFSTPKPVSLVESARDFDDAVGKLDLLLQGSLHARLADSKHPAAFLSGGVDSSLLCAVAAGDRPDLTALTVGFDNAAFDESPHAARVAAHLGIAHRVLHFSRSDYIGALDRLCAQMEQPMADPAAPATLLALEHGRNQFDMLLDGTGADESVGMLPPRHVRIAVGYASVLPARLRHGLANMMRRWPALSGYTPILDFDHPADTMVRWGGFSRTEIEALCAEPVSLAHTQFYRTFERFPRRAHFERYSALMGAQPSDRLNEAMRISGMPLRVPFFDSSTEGFLRQLRTDWRYLPHEPKRILRALLARYVPRQLWDIPKHGFNFPLHGFLAGEDFALVRCHLDPARWNRSGVLDGKLVWRYAQRYMAGDRRLLFRVWALIVLGAWLEKHHDPS